MSIEIFTLKYAEAEAKKYYPKEYSKGSITLDTKVLPKTRHLRGYIDHDVVDNQSDREILRFQIDGDVWMSITPMEIASHYVPIQKARGKVGVGGLGMGYFILKIMEKPEVTSIDIYELNPTVIEIFKDLHRDKVGFEKCNFILGDLLETCTGKQYDFFYNDIYLTLGSEEAPIDTHQLFEDNQIEDIHYWGMEYDIYESFAERQLMPLFCTDKHILKFFSLWYQYNYRYLSEENELFKELWLD